MVWLVGKMLARREVTTTQFFNVARTTFGNEDHYWAPNGSVSSIIILIIQRPKMEHLNPSWCVQKFDGCLLWCSRHQSESQSERKKETKR
jgi:hypothetical protein